MQYLVRSPYALTFLLSDIVLIGVYLGAALLLSTEILEHLPVWTNLGSVESVASMLMLVKWLVLAGLLALAVYRFREPALLIVTGVIMVLMLDDALEVHEAGGAVVAEALDIPAAFGLRPQDFGELAMFALLGIICFGGLLVAWFISAGARRRWVMGMILFIALLGFFGVFADMGHSASGRLSGPIGYSVFYFFAVLEDGGEMIVASLMVGYAHALLVAGPRPRQAG